MLPAPGQQLDLGQWAVGPDFVEQYLGAVGDGSSIYGELDVAPPMALAARALGALLQELALPPGTIHAAQELECRRMVRVGERVSCSAKLSRPLQRGGWQFVSAEFTLSGDNGEAVLGGKSTVLIPPEEVTGG